MVWSRNPLSAERRDFLKRFVLQRHGKVTPEQLEVILNDVGMADPTKSGKYSKWILESVLSGHIVFPEDIGKVKQSLITFHQAKNQFPVELRDINKYSNFSELFKVLNEYVYKYRSKTQLEIDGMHFLGQEAHFKIFQISNVEAATKVGQNTGWCICEQSVAKKYLKDGPLFLITKLDEKFLLLDPISAQVKDLQDVSLKPAHPDYIPVVKIIKKYVPQLICKQHSNFIANVVCPKCPEEINDGCILCEFATCHFAECNKEFCKKHSNNCSDCHELFCSEHINTCSGCKETSCDSHNFSCSSCKANICSTCYTNCQICSNMHCVDCLWTCTKCGFDKCSNCGGGNFCDKNCKKSYCDDCKKECPVCQNLICNCQQNSYEVRRCENCLEKICADCYDYCNLCQKLNCKDCFKENMCPTRHNCCPSCAPQVCDQCDSSEHDLVYCVGCDQILCEQCIIICQTGKHGFCKECAKEIVCEDCGELMCETSNHRCISSFWRRH